MDFKHSKGQWKHKTRRDALATPMMRDVDGTNKTLKRHDPGDAQETLGVSVAMNGNWKAQKEALKEKACAFKNQLQTFSMDRKEAYCAFAMSFMKN